MVETYTGPTSYLDQPEVKAVLEGKKADFSKGSKLCKDLSDLLIKKGISIEDISYRSKSPERIKKKIENPDRLPNPVLDLYGISIIANEDQIEKVLDVIREEFPMPDEFPWGIKTIRDGYNPYSHPDYGGIHANIMFDGNKIAEIKLYTPEQARMESLTREYYEANRK